MGLEVSRMEIAEAAGHLRAELVVTKDNLRQGRISEADYKNRVEIITRAAARFHKAAPMKTGTLVMTMEDVS